MDKAIAKLSYITIFVSGICLLSVFPASAQITPDDTLGNENSVVNPRDATSDSVDGGAIRGQNLFHSFQEFNVDAGRGVYFANPEAVTNIFSRVTGNNVSNILGTLGVDGAANLFLINPNGIIFGEGASLDVGGSFAATTANGIEFGEQGVFDTTNPQIPQLLTINPSAFLFNQIKETASIENKSFAPAGQDPFGFDSFGLRVSDGKSLSLLGGNLKIDGGILSFGGKVELGGLLTTGEIDIKDDGSLLFPQNIERGDVIFVNQALVDTSGQPGGEVQIQGKRVSLTDQSNIFSLTLNSQSGGNITIDASESVKLIGDGFLSRAGFFNAAQAEGIAGDIEITTKNLTVQNGARISTIAFEQGQGGDIKINATELVQLLGDEAGRLTETGILTGGGLIAESRGSGRAGNIEIVTGNLVLQDKTAISADSFDIGIGGSLNIEAENISIQSGSTISASTFGLADAGDVTVSAKKIEIDGITDNDSSSSITTQTGGFRLPNVDFTTVQDLTGNAGDLTINTERLIIRNGARIKSSTFNVGSAGDLKIEALESVELIGFGLSQSGLTSSGLFADTEADSTGNAGNLSLETNNLILQDGGRISSSSLGQGNAGDILLEAQDNINLSDGEISTVALFSSGGNINIEAKDLILKETNIASSVFLGSNNGGNIDITADAVIAFDNSDILAFAADGQGGNITLDTPAYFAENFTLNSLTSNPEILENNNRADVNATGAVSGAVTIPDVSFIQNSLNDLPDNSINTDELVANSCVSPVGNRQQGKFVITGTGGLPVRPGNGNMSDFSTGEVRNVPSNQTSWQRGEPIIEPQGLYHLADGKLVLSRECSNK